jgi:hypothetical protein
LGATTLSLFANSGAAPSGSALVSVAVTAEYANGASGGTPTVFVEFPLPISGLTASTTYWIVLTSAGTSGAHYTWYRSNQTSGASTSATGSSWSAQTYGFCYQIYDQTVLGNPVATWDDGGVAWKWFNYNGSGQINQIGEYTVAQNNSYVQSWRTITYGAADYPTTIS